MSAQTNIPLNHHKALELSRSKMKWSAYIQVYQYQFLMSEKNIWYMKMLLHCRLSWDLFQSFACVCPMAASSHKKRKNASSLFMAVSRPILESKGMRAIFRKRAKKGKILKIFWKRAASCVRRSHAWNSENMPWLFEYFKKVETAVSESARNKGLKEEEKNEVKKQRR